MLSIRALKLLPAWVTPDHVASSARILLEGHGIRALGVLDRGELAGFVTLDSLAGLPDLAELRSAVLPPTLIIDGDSSVREAADLFVRSDAEFAPVQLDGKFLGMVTGNMLLKELGRSWDPLTGLSWSDQLREWGIENLKRGHEITILFMDLDDFGQYNKRFGHIVGDQVLKRVATMFSECMDGETDCLVRYGGDEFAVGTIRERSEADKLAQLLKRRIDEIFIGEAEESVDFTIGIQGGKRSKERENVHFAATLDNLINLASKDCIAQKNAKQMLQERDAPSFAMVEIEKLQATEDVQPIRVISVFADDHTANSLTQVIVNIGDAVVSGVSARMGKSVIESIAHATAKALERKYPDRPMQVDDIHLTQGPEGQRMVSVTAHVLHKDQSIPVSGVKTVDEDLYSDVALASIIAFQQAKIIDPA